MRNIHSNLNCSASDSSRANYFASRRAPRDLASQKHLEAGHELRRAQRPSRPFRAAQFAEVLVGARLQQGLLRCGILSSTGRNFTSRPSSAPARCARTLDHFHSSARATSRARTGFKMT